MSDLLFNINDLISPSLQVQLEQTEPLGTKLEFLFQVIDFAHYFSAELVDEISSYYLTRTGERYEPIYLSSDDKEFLYEYSAYCPDFDKVKQVLNGICSSETYDECITKAQDEIEQIKQQELKEEQKSHSLTTHLTFNNDEHLSDTSNTGKKRGFDELLKSARARADERNSKSGN